MKSVTEAIRESILARCEDRERMLVAIDGRCASGKSTLAEELKKDLGCAVFHMDDFFLRPEQRTDKRLQIPGENVDHERFADEILCPLGDGAKRISFCAYDCSSQTLSDPNCVDVGRIVVIEGSYNCHPALWDAYDLRIFLTVSPEEQAERIRARDGEERLLVFQNRWIPLEESYFSAYHIRERCDLCFETDRERNI